jgi:hypothetical protein
LSGKKVQINYHLRIRIANNIGKTLEEKVAEEKIEKNMKILIKI